MVLLYTCIRHSIIIKGEFHCDVCKENFPFQSRLIRHLNTAAHRIMEATFRKHRQPIPKSSPTEVSSVRWYFYERYFEGAGDLIHMFAQTQQ